MKLPLISIILTTYNRPQYLLQALNSIANQTYENLEILLIDDGSDKDIAVENKKIGVSFDKCTYYYKKNSGQPDSRNYGLQRATGEYIGFCDDDDFWILDKLEKQVKVLISNPEIGLVTGNIEFVNEDGKRTGRVINQTGNHGYVFESFLLKNRTSSITPLLRKEVFEKVGYFNKKFILFEDWDFWRRVAYYYPFYALNDVLACVRKHGDNMSQDATKNPVEQYLRYRDLNKALLEWGENRFTAIDKRNVDKIAWQRYRKIMRNYCPGILNKIAFLLKIALHKPQYGCELILLFLKYEKVKTI